MTYKYFSLNGTILPAEQAVIPLSNLEYSYGFGVYETIRVTNGKAYFITEHCRRLMESALIISLGHTFTADFVQKSIRELLVQNKADTCNIKVLLIGGSKKALANLYIQCLNPLFPDRKLYSQGANCITYKYQRDFPQAKTLNMLASYLAYSRAQQADAYDALLVNHKGNLTEGTRTNLFVIKNQTIIGPPVTDILPGITRGKVLEVAKQNDFEILEQDIKISDLQLYDGAFLTSTSSKIVPIRKIDETSWEILPPSLIKLMAVFNEYFINL